MARAETQELIVDLKLRDQLTGGIAAAKGHLASLDATAAKTGTTLGGLSASLGGIAKAGAAAFLGFKAFDVASGFLGGAISKAIDEEKGIARLTASLKANVPVSQQYTDAVEAQVKANERFGFSDGEVRDSLALLAAATHNTAKAFDLIGTAQDLARFKGISLQEASQALTTVEAGRFRGLAQLGIVLKAGATQTEALAAVQRVAGGQAEAFGRSTEGAMRDAQVAIDNLQEDIGGKLSPAIAELARGLHTLLTPQQQTNDNWTLLGTAIRVITSPESIPAVIKQLEGTAIATEAAAERVAHLADNMSGLDSNQVAHLRDSMAGLTKDVGETSAAAATFSDVLNKGSAFWHQYTTDAQDTGAGLDNVAARARAAALGFDVLASSALTAAQNEALAADRRIGALGVRGPSADIGNLPGQDVTSNDSSLFVANAVQHTADVAAANAKAAADRLKAANKAASDGLSAAKQRAQELAAAYRDTVGNAFDAAKRRGDYLFDALHDRHIKAIKDAETLAQKQHDAALQQIADNLKAQQAANNAPVDAATKALRDREQAQQRRDLVEASQAAQQAVNENRDPAQAADLARALRAAKEALENFDAQSVIDRLTVVAGGLNLTAQGTATFATSLADTTLANAKAQAQKDADKATVDDQKQKQRFEQALAQLKDRDLKANKTPAELAADIAALEKRFGITTDAQGRHHIDDPLVTAIKAIKIPAPHITNIFRPNITIRMPNGRDFQASVVGSTSPSATSGVRSGQGGRP